MHVCVCVSVCVRERERDDMSVSSLAIATNLMLFDGIAEKPVRFHVGSSNRASYLNMERDE